MKLTASGEGDTLVIHVGEDRIDAASAIEFKDAMRDLTCGNENQIILNLEQVEFLDSSGLGAIVASMKYLGAERKLELAHLSPTVQKVFQLTRMDSVFTIHDSLNGIIGAGAKAS